MEQEKKAKRPPVAFRYDALNWDFIKMLAEIAHYADSKHGTVENYIDSRLVKNQGPVNHIYEHLRQYQTGEDHDHFTDTRYHLAAIAYNAMMEFYYHTNYGQITTPLVPANLKK